MHHIQGVRFIFYAYTIRNHRMRAERRTPPVSTHWTWSSITRYTIYSVNSWARVHAPISTPYVGCEVYLVRVYRMRLCGPNKGHHPSQHATITITHVILLQLICVVPGIRTQSPPNELPSTDEDVISRSLNIWRYA
jgi:hypothetical protein